MVMGGCSKSPLCWGDDKNKGIIISNLTVNPLHCIDPFQLPDQEYVINDYESYINLITDTVYCDSSSLPDIDFSQNTLLGQYATGGCEVKFIREVTNNSADNEYFYEITVRDCGACERLRYSMNWVIVPKLPENYNVRFNIKQ